MDFRYHKLGGERAYRSAIESNSMGSLKSPFLRQILFLRGVTASRQARKIRLLVKRTRDGPARTIIPILRRRLSTSDSRSRSIPHGLSLCTNRLRSALRTSSRLSTSAFILYRNFGNRSCERRLWLQEGRSSYQVSAVLHEQILVGP